MLKRMHVNRGGLIYQLPAAIDEKGNISSMPVKTSRPISESQIKQTGCPVFSQSQINNIMQQNQNGVVRSVSDLPFAVAPYEDVLGNPGFDRVERQNVEGQRTVIRISITNNELTDEEILIGDHHGLLAFTLGVGAIKAGVVVGGTWGTSTLAFLKQITGANPYRLAGVQFQSFTAAGIASEVFYNTGFFKLAEADVANRTTKDEELILADLVRPSTFQTNIREDDSHRFLMDGFSGYHLLVPTGQKVQINLTMVSYANSYNMNRVSTKG